jgi:hypothetical protein
VAYGRWLRLLKPKHNHPTVRRPVSAKALMVAGWPRRRGAVVFMIVVSWRGWMPICRSHFFAPSPRWVRLVENHEVEAGLGLAALNPCQRYCMECTVHMHHLPRPEIDPVARLHSR